MKKGILFLIVLISINASSQSLKDLLYGGKLKTDSGTVLHKGDDLSSKIDTSKKKPVDAEKNKLALITLDSSGKKMTEAIDTSAMAPADKMDNAAASKDNNKIWKEFIDSVISSLKDDVLTSKKIKKGEYFITIDYSIETDGQVTINNVYPAPENKYLEEQVKQRLTLSAPHLNPVITSNGKPRKVMKKYNFTVTRM
jgi:hypothetical protein